MNDRVLIVEDNNLLTELLGTVFELEGLQVLVANSSREGIRMAREKPPDLVLIDLKMPGMDGFAVFEALLANEATMKIPVAFFSNFSTPKDRKKAKEMGAVDFIIKCQFPPHELTKRIRQLLDGKTWPES